MKTYYTAGNNQTEMRFEILQGESMYCRDNISLGAVEIKVPKGPAGKESADVRFTYDINGILEVDIKCNSTGELTKKVIINKNITLTEDEIKAKCADLEKIKILLKYE